MWYYPMDEMLLNMELLVLRPVVDVVLFKLSDTGMGRG